MMYYRWNTFNIDLELQHSSIITACKNLIIRNDKMVSFSSFISQWWISCKSFVWVFTWVQDLHGYSTHCIVSNGILVSSCCDKIIWITHRNIIIGNIWLWSYPRKFKRIFVVRMTWYKVLAQKRNVTCNVHKSLTYSGQLSLLIF